MHSRRRVRTVRRDVRFSESDPADRVDPAVGMLIAEVDPAALSRGFTQSGTNVASGHRPPLRSRRSPESEAPAALAAHGRRAPTIVGASPTTSQRFVPAMLDFVPGARALGCVARGEVRRPRMLSPPWRSPPIPLRRSPRTSSSTRPTTPIPVRRAASSRTRSASTTTDRTRRSASTSRTRFRPARRSSASRRRRARAARPSRASSNCALGDLAYLANATVTHPGHPADAWRLHEHRVGDVGHDRSQHVEQPQRHRSDDGAERHRHGAGRRQPGRTGQRRHRLQLRADGDQQRPAGGGVADDRVRGSRGRVRHVRADRHRLGVRAGGGLPAVRGADDHLHAQHVARVRRERAEPDGPRGRQRRRFRHRRVHREFAAARRQLGEQHGRRRPRPSTAATRTSRSRRPRNLATRRRRQQRHVHVDAAAATAASRRRAAAGPHHRAPTRSAPG